MADRDNFNVEDGMSFAGLVPTAAERREERARKAVLAAAREEGRREGDATGYARGLKDAAEIARALQKGERWNDGLTQFGMAYGKVVAAIESRLTPPNGTAKRESGDGE